MNTISLITLIYGLLVFIGGIMGYVKAKSKASIISGSIFGVLLVISALMLQKNDHAGWWLGLICTFFIAAFFGKKLFGAIKTKESIGRPAVLLSMSVVELVVLFCL